MIRYKSSLHCTEHGYKYTIAKIKAQLPKLLRKVNRITKNNRNLFYSILTMGNNGAITRENADEIRYLWDIFNNVKTEIVIKLKTDADDFVEMRIFFGKTSEKPKKMTPLCRIFEKNMCKIAMQEVFSEISFCPGVNFVYDSLQ